jgi:RNA polymerase sigma factor (sigma-70 family)
MSSGSEVAPDRRTGDKDQTRMAAPETDRSARLAELLARTALSDQAAYAELYRLTASHLYGVALRILREPAAAEDMLQEAFVNVWHHAGSYRAVKAKPQTWLTSIVRNRCLDQLRRREPDTVSMTREEDATEVDYHAPGPTPVEMLLAGADAHSVRGCVDSLDGGQKQAIALAFYQGLSHAELAEHLRQPLGTVKSWVRRGLERLKACLEGAGFAR